MLPVAGMDEFKRLEVEAGTEARSVRKGSARVFVSQAGLCLRLQTPDDAVFDLVEVFEFFEPRKVLQLLRSRQVLKG